jgi:EmrB/QacA subfamily drug resistance transporter
LTSFFKHFIFSSMTKRVPLLLTLLLAAFVVGLDTTLVNVALPDLSRQLGASTQRLQWVVDAFNLVFAAFLLSAGSLSDRLGRRRMLIVGLAVFGTGSLIGSAATSTGELIAVRAVMGLGAALAFPATLSLILDAFPERTERARAIGLWGAVAGVAIATGPIVGGWLLSEFTWPSIFIAMAPVAYLAIGCALAFIPKGAGESGEPLDLGGLVTSALAMAALVFTIIEAPGHGWSSVRTLSGFAAAVVLLGGFINREHRSSTPMIDLQIFRNARFSAASLAVTVVFFSLFGFIFLATQYFQFIRGYSPLGTGVRLLPFAVSVAVGSIAGTNLAVRFGTKQIVVTGLLLSAAFYTWDTTTTAHLSYAIISMQMVLGGLGMGLTSAPATESIMGAVSSKTSGVGSAVNDTTRLVGGTLGVAVIGSVFSSLDRHRITDQLSHTALPRAALDASAHSVQGGIALARQLGNSGSPLGQVVHTVTTNAFLYGLHAGCVVAAAVAVLGAVVTAIALPSQPAPTTADEQHTSAPPKPTAFAADRRPERTGVTHV